MRLYYFDDNCEKERGTRIIGCELCTSDNWKAPDGGGEKVALTDDNESLCPTCFKRDETALKTTNWDELQEQHIRISTEKIMFLQYKEMRDLACQVFGDMDQYVKQLHNESLVVLAFRRSRTPLFIDNRDEIEYFQNCMKFRAQKEIEFRLLGYVIPRNCIGEYDGLPG